MLGIGLSMLMHAKIGGHLLVSHKTKSLNLIKSNKHFLSSLLEAEKRAPETQQRREGNRHEMGSAAEATKWWGAETEVGGLQVRDGPK